ncbi:phage tail protein [Xanthomonas cucurbitae]|uniref:Phage tail protein n=1 Tax=Xanthomonas cucurbitae TaxID=56453 RepID=A0ABY7Y8H9_9XANT|nr:phage tail protein [Xanthomonas cucurbitae]WDM66290.1 phage tail protein [Xanthomonas cucurbitae]WDM70167.1 phage tail protein [Xanthomonas cucurbitae]
MTNALPPTSAAYAFDPTTGEFIGTVTVYLSEMEGRYPLPPNTVAVEPVPAAGLYQRHRLSTATGSWEVVPDYRGVMLYSTDTAAPLANMLTLGDALPKGCTTSQPIAFLPSDFRRNVWDDARASWRADPDYSAALVWEKATGAIAPRLAAGIALPGQLTTVAPPMTVDGTLQWDEAAQGWIVQPRESDVAEM